MEGRNLVDEWSAVTRIRITDLTFSNLTPSEYAAQGFTSLVAQYTLAWLRSRHSAMTGARPSLSLSYTRVLSPSISLFPFKLQSSFRCVPCSVSLFILCLSHTHPLFHFSSIPELLSCNTIISISSNQHHHRLILPVNQCTSGAHPSEWFILVFPPT
jgi:hypothetical protein